MVRTAIQLYTLRDVDDSLPDLLARVGETEFEGVEFAGLGGTEPAEIAAALDDAGLSAAGAHVDLAALETEFDDVVAAYDELGCDTLVVPYLDETHFESEDAVRETARRLTDVADRLADRGVQLCYHNHDHEFVDVEGAEGDAFDLLVDLTDDLGIELDVGWALAAGRDPVALLSRLAGRVPLVHCKDVAVETRTPVELGEGDLDLDACARAAREAGAEWLVYEHDDPDDPLRSLATGSELLASLR